MAQAFSNQNFSSHRFRAREFIILIIGLTIGILISLPSHHYSSLLPKASSVRPPTPQTVPSSHPTNVYNTQIIKSCPSTAALSSGTTKIHCLYLPRAEEKCKSSYTSWTSDPNDRRNRVQARYHIIVRLLFKYHLSIDILDIGANVGTVTFGIMALNYGHRVMAVEPFQESAAGICKTAQLNGWLNSPQLSIVNAALSDHVGKNTIEVPVRRYTNKSIISNGTEVNEEIKTRKENVTFLDGDGLLEETGFAPRIIRVDAMGYEFFAMKGLQKYLRDSKRGDLIVIAEINRETMKTAGVDPKQFFELMEELGYVCYCKPRFDVGLTGYTSVRKGTKVSKDDFLSDKKQCKLSYFAKA